MNMLKKIPLIACLITLTQASDCVTQTIQREITIPSSNQLPFEIHSPFPGKIVFKKHFDDNARNVMRITGQVSHQTGRNVSFIAESVESVQAYTTFRKLGEFDSETSLLFNE